MVASMTDDAFDALASQISPADLKRLAEAKQQDNMQAPVVEFPEGAPRSDPAVSLDAGWTTHDDQANLRQLLLADDLEDSVTAPRSVRWWDVFGLIQILALSLGMIGERTVRKSADAKARFNRLPSVVRGAYLVTLATIILAGVGYFVGSVAYDHVKAQQGPFLSDALAAPYDLAARPAPPASASVQYLLPASLGSYARTSRPITQLQPSSPTNQCLLGLGYSREETNPPLCHRSYGMVSTAAAKYQGGNRFVDVAIGQSLSEEQAAQTMLELFYHARRYGQVGNFAVESVGEVDYFYSSVRGWVSFTWARGPWIFSISSNRVSTVEDVLSEFPY